jgi:membrane associated rhomboid family serine protease
MSYYRSNGFSALPVVVKNLLIINGLVFLFLFSPGSIREWMYQHLALWIPGHRDFIPTQYVTYQFMHSYTDPFHILFNMFSLWMFGTMVENIWGPRRFLTYYLLCGIGAGVFQNLFHFISLYEYLDMTTWTNLANNYVPPMVGASGSIYGLLAAYGYLFPNSYVNIYFFIPIKAKYFVILLMAISLFSGLSNQTGDNVAHFAHLGGAIVGLILIFGRSLFIRRRF